MLTGCVLLDALGVSFHPGPPEGIAFAGMTRFALFIEVQEGAGVSLRNDKLHILLPIYRIFEMARTAFHQDLSAVDVYVPTKDYDFWRVDGPVLSPQTPGEA